MWHTLQLNPYCETCRLCWVKAGVSEDLGQVMTLSAQRVRPFHAGVRIGIKIGDQSTGRGRLAEFVAPLQQVGPLRSMGTVGARAAEFAVVVAVVAIGAEELVPTSRAEGDPVSFNMFTSRLGCGSTATTRVSHGMARGCRRARIPASRSTGRALRPREWADSRKIGRPLLAHAGSVTAQTGFILIDGRNDRGHAVERTDAGCAMLRRTNGGWRAKTALPGWRRAHCGNRRKWRAGCC